MEVFDTGISGIWPVQLCSCVVPVDFGRKIPAVLKRIRSESTGSGTEPMGNGSGWLSVSWNMSEFKGTV